MELEREMKDLCEILNNRVAIDLIDIILRDKIRKIRFNVFNSLMTYEVWNDLENQVKDLLIEAINIGIDF